MTPPIFFGNDIAVDLFMRSHPLPSRGGVRGGVCNISNILSAKSVGEEVSAKSGLQRSGSEGVAAKNITDITDPTPAPPRKGRVQEGMAAHKSFLQRVNCYIIAIFYQRRRDSEEEAAKKGQQI